MITRDFIEVPPAPIIGRGDRLEPAEAEYKALASRLEPLDEAGEFEGLGAIYDVRDEQGDIIERGAFLETLKQRGSKVPLLFQHDVNEILGMAELQDTPQGLRVRGKLNLAISKAREAYELLKQGAIHGLSIGYETLRSTYRNGARVLQAVNLFEVSLTAFPAQRLAVVVAVKSAPADEDDADAAIRELLAEMRAWARTRTVAADAVVMRDMLAELRACLAASQ